MLKYIKILILKKYYIIFFLYSKFVEFYSEILEESDEINIIINDLYFFH